MASGQPMVSSLFAQDSVNPLSFFLKKFYGDGRVASVIIIIIIIMVIFKCYFSGELIALS